MFVCAVCDPSQPVQSPKPPRVTFSRRVWPFGIIIRYSPHRKSAEVIHVGDAVVTFQQEFVVPLFLISWDMPKPSANMILKHHAWVRAEQPWALPQQVGRRRLAVPLGGEHLIRFGAEHDPLQPRRGREVWIVPDFFEERTPFEIRVWRRKMERRWLYGSRKHWQLEKWARLGIC